MSRDALTSSGSKEKALAMAAAGAGGLGSFQECKQKKHQRKDKRIPQQDGNGDEEEYYKEEFEGDGDQGDYGDAGEDAGEDVDDDDDAGKSNQGLQRAGQGGVMGKLKGRKAIMEGNEKANSQLACRE
jgi:hypothetical protein